MADAIKIQPPASSDFSDNLDVFWIHTIAAARSNQAPQAAASLADFKKSSSEFEKQHGWGDLIRLELLEAEAWTDFAQHDEAKAVAKLHEAMSFEKAHPIYYPDVLPRPSPEMLGEMLLLLKSSDKALDAFKVALTIAPNRLNSLIGGRDAALASHRPELAAGYAAIIASICGNKPDRAVPGKPLK